MHLYPCYDLTLALSSLAANLGRTPAAARAAFLAEQRDCQAFAALRAGAGPTVRTLADAGALLVGAPGDPPLFLFAGRQLVTAERVEILALLVDDAPADGLDAERTVDGILAAGGVPVVGWSPGKWAGGRGRIVRRLLERFGAGALLLGDTALRPAGAPEPRLMRLARRRGIGVVAGSDPLPFPGEERLLGSYASVFDGAVDPARPVESARRLLRSAPRAGTAGARGSWAGAARRWLRNARTPSGALRCAG